MVKVHVSSIIRIHENLTLRWLRQRKATGESSIMKKLGRMTTIHNSIDVYWNSPKITSLWALCKSETIARARIELGGQEHKM